MQSDRIDERMAGEMSRSRAWRRPLLATVVAIVAVILGLAPLGLDNYTIGLVSRAFCFALLAISVDLLWGYAGVLSLGQSAFFGIGAYSTGILFSHVTSAWWGAPAGLLAGLVVSVLLALALGWFIFYARISLIFPFYVSVVTLALAVVFYQLVLSGGDLTGSSQGLSGFESISMRQDTWYFVLLACLVFFAYAAYVLVNSDAGRMLIAVRENEERCRYLGYDTPCIKVLLFAVCAGIASISGTLYAAYTTIVAPSLVGFTLGTDAVIWTALGGRGTLLGPILGASIVNVIGPTLNAKFPFLWQLFLGILFVVVVTVAPRGLLPLLVRPLARLFSGGKAASALPADLPDRGRLSPGPARFTPGQARAAGVKSGEQRPAALVIEGVTKNFGSLHVLNNVNLQAKHGELVSVVGPNGAGKTTLIRCIADGAERTGGRILVEGNEIGALGPHKVVGFGVGRKFQAANVFDSLPVVDCLRLASWRGRMPSVVRRSKELELAPAAWRILEVTGLIDHLDELAGKLSHGLRQSLELAMVLALKPTVLLLDEPTAGLTKEERGRIARVLAELRDTGELCILLIEHDFEFVKQISSRMVVLHQGEVVLDGSVEEVAGSDLVRSIYLGQAHGKVS